jgi:hypothetical protein
VLRTVIPIRNRAECYGCHDARYKINGILILDGDCRVPHELPYILSQEILGQDPGLKEHPRNAIKRLPHGQHS